MWWCCGNRNPNAKGCKTQKHTTHDDRLDSTFNQNIQGAITIKCQCCKQIGHTMTACPQDPNIRTGFELYNAEEEDDRIAIE